jgi:hypothetical protein
MRGETKTTGHRRARVRRSDGLDKF